MDRHVADREKGLVHRTLVADSALRANEEGTFILNQTLIFMVNGRLIFMVKAWLTRQAGRIDPIACAD
jgi:hypothetical protein